MANTGFGATLAGTGALASITGIQSASIGGVQIDRITWSEFGDTNAVANNLPGKVVDGVMSVTLTYSKTLYAALRTKALARTSDTWTYTCGTGDGSTYSGTGYLASVGPIEEGSDGVDTYTIEIFPATNWTYAAA